MIRAKPDPHHENPGLDRHPQTRRYRLTRPTWQDDADLFPLIRQHLYTPVIGDCLDTLGRYHAFLPQAIQGMTPRMKVVGRAMPALHVDVFGPQARPFGRLTEALDQLRPGEVYLGGGGSAACALWGELLTATAKQRGALGAVVDGYHRDSDQVLSQDWPVFSHGAYAQDSAVRTRVESYRCPVEIGGVWVEPGDLIVGDRDGVVVVPRAVETDVITRALEKASGEKVVRQAIEAGMTSTQAFEKYGIL